MTRLLESIRCDIRLQYRNGFYYAVAFLMTCWGVLVTRIPSFDWAPWMPPVVLGNIMIGTFMFMGGLVLLEKGEGTLEALVVSPLRDSEYLGSKTLSLVLLAVVEHLILVGLTLGFGFSPLQLILGVVLGGALYCLAGFMVVSRYDSINEYLFPSFVYSALLSIPMLPYFGFSESPLYYIHPMKGPLVLLKSAFEPVGWGEMVYGVAYSLFWIAVLFRLSQATFLRFIVRREGAR